MTVSVATIICFLCHNWKCCRIVNVSFYPPGLLSVALGNNSDSFRNVTVTTVESGKKMSEYAVCALSNATSLQNTNKNGWIIAFPSQLSLKWDLLCSFPFWLKRIWNFGHIYSIILYLDSYKTFMVMLIMFLFCRVGITSPRLPKWQPDWNQSRKCYRSTNEFISRLILILIHCTSKSLFPTILIVLDFLFNSTVLPTPGEPHDARNALSEEPLDTYLKAGKKPFECRSVSAKIFKRRLNVL